MYHLTTIPTILLSWLLCAATSAGQLSVPAIPSTVAGKDAVKSYLVSIVARSQDAAAKFEADAQAYKQLADAHAGDINAAAQQDPSKVGNLITALRDDFKGIHNFGYEYIEGIVAGVPSLMKYDVELDGGVPAAGASVQDNIAPVRIVAGPLVIDREGSLNSFIIEATVYGTNPRFIVGQAALPGFDKPVALPNPTLVVAEGNYAIDGYGRLARDAAAWQPVDKDLFQAMYNMTPSLSDNFDEWKESKVHGSAAGGRFVGVSRISDMRGIMGSIRLAWLCEHDQVSAKDPALAQKISQGYDQILAFLDRIYNRDQAKPLHLETIDALGSQIKEKGDQLTVQVAQAAALLSIDVSGK